MLLNKILSALIIFSFLFLLFSCGETEEKKISKAPVKNYEDPAVLLQEVKNALGKNTKVAYLGLFESKHKSEIVGGAEVNTKDVWGIKFALLKITNDKLKKEYETRLLNGSFNSSFVSKIKLQSTAYELIYYNSQGYFLGSGGGEIFSYLIDFNIKEVFYSHLVIESKEISLYLSDNIESPEVRNFFINNFKKDYPSLTLVSKDLEIDD